MLIIEVNRSEVENLRDFKNAVGKRRGKGVLLRVKTHGGTVFMNLPVND